MSMFSNVSRIIFDLDNTLIKHDFEGEQEFISRAIGLEGNADFKKQLENMFRTNINYIGWKVVTEEYFAEIIEHLIPILKEVDKTGMDVLNAIYDANPGELMCGAKDLLEYLQNSGYEIVVLTNWFYSHQFNALKRLGIFDYFERIYSWDTYYAKPNRLAMLRALGSTLPENNVVIGDDPLGDITVAKNCGINTIGFNIDYSKLARSKKIKVADVNVSSLYEIKYYL